MIMLITVIGIRYDMFLTCGVEEGAADVTGLLAIMTYPCLLSATM